MPPGLRDAVFIGATWLVGIAFAGAVWLAAYRLLIA